MKAKDVTVKLDSLSNLIKRTSEIFEIADTPAHELYSAIEESCDSATQSILAALPVRLEDYERDFADWKIAWKENREILIDFCKEKLGEPAKRKKGEGLVLYSKRLLIECLRAQLGKAWQERVPSRDQREGKFVEDQDAHDAVKRWGGMSNEAFKADLQQADQDIIRRAAEALGIRVSLKAKTFSDKLYKASIRFSNNTTLF